MPVKTEAADILFRKLAEMKGPKGAKKLNYGVWATVEENIDDERIDLQYLYNSSRKIADALSKEKDEVGLKIKHLDYVAEVLGYDSFYDFEKKLSKVVSKELMNYKGNWWSFVRANEGDDILKAPVSIYYDKGMGMYMRLKGEENIFRGPVNLRAGCLFCELDSERNKKVYMVMKGSANEKFDVLQGTFTGISSASDPIAGREVFVKEERLRFEEMKWERLNIYQNTLDQRINDYFMDKKKNCIKVANVSTYTLEDLVPEQKKEKN